jgi:hypothetical protein
MRVSLSVRFLPEISSGRRKGIGYAAPDSSHDSTKQLQDELSRSKDNAGFDD